MSQYSTNPKTTSVSQLAPRALTLIEMLVGMAITLVMMAAVVTLFANIGAGIRVQRAGMEMSSQLRTTRARLFMDLAGATCAPRPKLPTDDHDDGYIEIVEGEYSDKNPSLLLTAGGTPGVDRLDYSLSQVPSSNLTLTAGDVTDGGALGDYDDILALTVRSENAPFVGRMPIWDPTLDDGEGNAGWWRISTIESNLAEVIWYSVENPVGSLEEPGMRTIYRRVMLIAPWIDDLPVYAGAAPSKRDVVTDSDYYRLCDVSFRREGDLRVPNTLSDLTKRENRFAHHIDGPSTFPHAIWLQNIRVLPETNGSPLHPFGDIYETFNITETESSERQGEDVMLNDVLAFDVRVYDPGAPIVNSPTNLILETTDVGWFAPASVAEVQGYGGYVDLGWSPGYTAFSGASAPLFQNQHQAGWYPRTSIPADYPAVYDTWSYHYENDGIDQDSANDNGAGIDQGTNGLDDDVVGTGAINGTDDVGERETSPPYDVPLRGIQVKLRVYEPDTRQIREATITRGLVPQ